MGLAIFPLLTPPTREPAIVGVDYVVGCDVEFQPPTATVDVSYMWLDSDGNVLPVDGADSRSVSTEGELEFLPSKQFHAGEYTCMVTTVNGVSMPSSAQVEVNRKSKSNTQSSLPPSLPPPLPPSLANIS